MIDGLEVIDFRARPPSSEFLAYFSPGHVEFFAARQVLGDLAPSYYNRSIDMFFDEADAAGIDKLVVVNRVVPAAGGSPACDIPNDHIAELIKLSPNRMLGIAGIDIGGSFGDPLVETERCVRELGLRGIHISPGRSVLETGCDDRRLYPIYELCLSLRIPVLIMSGPFSGARLDSTHPLHIQKVASDFPRLDIVVGHACWPYTNELIGVAYRHANVYISSDSYLYMPAAGEMVRAVGDLLQDQFIYASSYPVGSLGAAIQRFRELPYRETVFRKTLGENAKRVLRL